MQRGYLGFGFAMPDAEPDSFYPLSLAGHAEEIPDSAEEETLQWLARLGPASRGSFCVVGMRCLYFQSIYFAEFVALRNDSVAESTSDYNLYPFA